MTNLDNGLIFTFFGVKPGEPEESMRKRLEDTKKAGFHAILASCPGVNGFAFDEAYFDMLRMLAKICDELEMGFWLEDYAPFPTGSANGAFALDEYKKLNKLFIDERHLDVSGPISNAKIRIDALTKVVFGKAMHRFAKVDPGERERIAVVACRMDDNTDYPRLVEETMVELDSYIDGEYLTWDVPDGHWRVFAIFTTYESSGRPNYMNLLSKDSVKLEIEKVHAPIYECLKHEIGKSWLGFFYDEPEIGNAGGEKVFDFFMLPGRRSQQPMDCDVYPWCNEMPEVLSDKDRDWKLKLPYLWYDADRDAKQFRVNYMDAVSSLVRENYNGQVYAFCNEKGIQYMGHVLEDEGSHARLGCGPGHYFRQQYYQDEAGIDVIAGQILPGKDHTTSWYGVTNADGAFYHYGLAKLASSESHINPLKKNRTLAECFAMYGQQGLAEKKFLVDHLLVNGINRILTVGVSAFLAPQEYATKFLDYAERMCQLSRESTPIIKTAILYHAESEWRNGTGVQKFHQIGAKLAQNQISYDVIPADVFTYPDRYDTDITKGLCVNGIRYEALIVPATNELPPAVASFAENCRQMHYPVICVDTMPENVSEENEAVSVVPLDELVATLEQLIRRDISLASSQKRWIRYLHAMKDGSHFYMIHNEAPADCADCEIRIPDVGEMVIVDVLGEMAVVPEQEVVENERKLYLHLGKYEMVLLCQRGMLPDALRIVTFADYISHENSWTLSEAKNGKKVSAQELPDPEEICGADYYGKLTYKTNFDGDALQPDFLSLGTVSDCCEVFINGKSAGKRMASPYLYDVAALAQPGLNELMVEVHTSATNIKNPGQFNGVPVDAITAVPYQLVEPMGITGPVEWINTNAKGR